MSISRDDIARMARLAELAIDERELVELTGQLERIVMFVERLNEVTDDAGSEPFIAGPAACPLREDEVRPASLAHPVAEMAPEFVDGLFAVPLRGALEEDP